MDRPCEILFYFMVNFLVGDGVICGQGDDVCLLPYLGFIEGSETGLEETPGISSVFQGCKECFNCCVKISGLSADAVESEEL